MGRITFQYGELPEGIIGVASLKSRTITVSKPYKNSEKSTYYVAMLENALIEGYDCVLRLEGVEVVRKMMVGM